MPSAPQGTAHCPSSDRKAARSGANPSAMNSGAVTMMPMPKPVMDSKNTDSPSTSTSTRRSEEHTSELQSLMRISYAVFCLKKKTTHTTYICTRQPKILVKQQCKNKYTRPQKK